MRATASLWKLGDFECFITRWAIPRDVAFKDVIVLHLHRLFAVRDHCPPAAVLNVSAHQVFCPPVLLLPILTSHIDVACAHLLAVNLNKKSQNTLIRTSYLDCGRCWKWCTNCVYHPDCLKFTWGCLWIMCKILSVDVLCTLSFKISHK